MIAKLFIVGLFICGVHSVSIKCDTDQCAKPLKVYNELGCKAIFGTNSCCPKRFECDDFKKLDENKCHFDGIEYSIGEILPRNFTDDSKCVETCFCSRYENEPAKFSCSNSECGVAGIKVSGCINVYGDLNECCSTSIICDEDEKETLASCWLSKEYRDGEKFIPETNPCYECLCHKDFDNTTIVNNPHCRQINCEIDLRYKSFVQRGCLPVFAVNKCCPVDWECPKTLKKVIKRAADESEKLFVVTPQKLTESIADQIKVDVICDDGTSLAEFAELNTNPLVPPIDSEYTSKSSIDATTQIIPTEETTLPFKIETKIVEDVISSSPPVAVTESSIASETSTSNAVEGSTYQSTTNISKHNISEDLQVSHKEENTIGEDLNENFITTIPASTTSDSVSTVAYQESSEKSSKPKESNEEIYGESKETTASLSKVTTTTPTYTTTQEIVKENLKLENEELTTFEPELTTLSEIQTFSTDAFSETTSTSSLTSDITTEIIKASSSTEASKIEETSLESLSSSTESLETEIDLISESLSSSTESLETEIDLRSLQADERIEEATTSLPVTTFTPITTQAEIIRIEESTEFVNFTVSISQNDEKHEGHSIEKRSVYDADLIPQYNKHSLPTEKGCTFSGRFYKIGEVIKTENDCLKCHCDYAPIGHCLLKEKCNI